MLITTHNVKKKYYCLDVLERWEVPPINEVNRKLEKIERAIKRQDEAIDEVR